MRDLLYCVGDRPSEMIHSENKQTPFLPRTVRLGLFYVQTCAKNGEGIVAKHRDSPYVSERTISTWYKIRNPRSSQMIGRHELFERERHSEPIPRLARLRSGVCGVGLCEALAA